MKKKRCPRCKLEKTFRNFYKVSTRPNNISAYCIECCKIKAKAENIKYRTRIKIRRKKYLLENKEKIKIYKKKYKQLNREQIRKYENNRYKNFIEFRLAHLLRRRLGSAIRNNYKTGSAVNDLGCSIKYLKSYLEKKFEIGMNWNNQGEWHIDHIKPLSNFDLTNRKQFLKANHYTNLQPLWAKDNMSKGNRER